MKKARCHLTTLLLSMLLFAGCGKSPESEEKTPAKSSTAATDGKMDTARLEAIRLKIQAFCGDCHATPNPDSFPKDAWFKEVEQGYRFYDESKRTDLLPPPMSEVVAYYRQLAPEKLVLPEVAQTTSPGLNLKWFGVPRPSAAREIMVSHVRTVKGSSERRTDLLLSDMRTSQVSRIAFDANTPTLKEIARLEHPALIRPVEFDGDRRPGYIVAELGSFLPEDHNKGKVIWLRSNQDGTAFEKHVLAAGLGRIADVQPADFDGDGRIDLIVAEFGWRKTGRILQMKQTGRKEGIPQFEITVIDKRHGTIHVPVVDLNGDGRPDFIALISQEYESVEAFLNRGDGTFEKKVLYQAPDPSYGSSGIQVVDLDGDGDLDVIYTNGDSLDSFILKPYHAVHWLENRGEFPFTHHELTRFPGVSRAIAADLDGDGDLDIVACAYLPEKVTNQAAGKVVDTIIWLEQRENKTFRRHRIEQSAVGHLTLDVGDFNGDGRTDFAVGNVGADAKNWADFWCVRLIR